jgi:hypothetical protein
MWNDMENMKKTQVEWWKAMEIQKKSKLNSEMTWKTCRIVIRYDKNGSWNVKWYGKYGRKTS